MYRRKSFDPNRTLGRREAKKAAKLNQIYKESESQLFNSSKFSTFVLHSP